MNETVRKVATLAILAMMLATGFAVGEERGPCYEAYRESGLNQQQMTFHQFRQFYGDTLCARDGSGLAATHVGQVPGETG
jgi:hypothetical protein